MYRRSSIKSDQYPVRYFDGLRLDKTGKVGLVTSLFCQPLPGEMNDSWEEVQIFPFKYAYSPPKNPGKILAKSGIRIWDLIIV